MRLAYLNSPHAPLFEQRGGMPFPLPLGEGQGEGDRASLNRIVRLTEHSFNPHSVRCRGPFSPKLGGENDLPSPSLGRVGWG